MVSEYTYSPHVDFFIDHVDRDTGYEMPSFHIHHKYEIYYEIEGTRRYFIEDAAYIVNAGSVVLIGENQIHKTASVGDTPSSRIVMNFSGEYLGKLVELFPDVDFFSFLSEEHNHLLSNITVKQQNHIHSMLQQLLTLQEKTTPESDAIRKMLLATLLLELKEMCKQQQVQGGENGRVSNHIVDQIQAYIAEHYAEKLTLTGIASQFYISPYYLSRLFKKSINLSLIEYINGVRIKAAQNLIEKSNESISDIAERTGFLTTAHFRRVFKDATGLSPQQYRQYYKRVNK
ncbi:MAG: AraC family transcriptional regulator [Subdoligranulum variabile]|nr:AraC family transcriptional regulator [Subdoligranulum variabile]